MFGIDIFEPQTMWLNITNLALGLITLACILVFFWGVAAEIVARTERRAAAAADDHAFAVPGLGMTMADGGKKVDDNDDEEEL